MIEALQVPPQKDLSLREQQIAVLGSYNQVGHVIHVLGELRVADHLARRPLTAADLAALTETTPSALYRVLRCAAAVGILAEQPDGTFTLTDVGEGLRSDKLGGLLPLVRFSGSDFVRQAYAQILHSVRTGKPAFSHVFGISFYEYLERNCELGEDFERFLAHWSRQLSQRFAHQLRLQRFHRIADIGGGDAYFLATILQDHPDGVGELFDLPAVAARAQKLLAQHGLSERATVTAGDFFKAALPAGCDAYILKSIIHNWSDEQADVILRGVRAAMGDVDSRLLIIDQLVPALNQWDHSKVIDIDMLVLFGGKERDLEEWQSLFAAARFELVNEPTDGWTVLECRPT